MHEFLSELNGGIREVEGRYVLDYVEDKYTEYRI